MAAAGEASPTPRRWRRLWPLPAAVLLGAVQSLGFDRSPSLILPWVAWAPLVFFAFDGRWSLRRLVAFSWLTGIVFWTITVGWISHSIGVHGGLPMPLAWCLLLLLTTYMGCYWAAFAAAARLLAPAPGAAAWRQAIAVLGVAGLWCLLEILREVLFSGFPWTPLGEAIVDVPGALPLAAWIGGRGLSLLVLSVNAALALVLVRALRPADGGSGSATSSTTRLTGRSFPRSILEPEILVAGAFVCSVLILLSTAALTAPALPRTDDARPVRLVQPNVPIGPPPDQVIVNYRRLLDLSACAQADTLVVWPESAAFPLLWQRSERLRRDVATITAAGCSVLLNSAWIVEREDGGRGFTNSALLVPDGTVDRAEIQRYDKLHLVPYGEYVPLGDVLPFVRQLARSVGQFEPGGELSLLRWRDLRLGLSICFEVLFPHEVAERVRAGAQVLAVLTNDAWFGDSRGPYQHLVSARVRAAETRRPVLFAAVTGVSAAIDARGRVIDSLPLDEAGVLDIDLAELGLPRSNGRGATAITPYVAHPRRVDGLAAVLLLVAAVAAFASRRSRPPGVGILSPRRTGGSDPPDETPRTALLRPTP